MLEELEDQQVVHQDYLVEEIIGRFGVGFTYINANGNRAIDRKVLREFFRLTNETVVWMRGERAWRMRENHDPPGRQA